jgi:hypothetical protein
MSGWICVIKLDIKCKMILSLLSGLSGLIDQQPVTLLLITNKIFLGSQLFNPVPILPLNYKLI